MHVWLSERTHLQAQRVMKSCTILSWYKSLFATDIISLKINNEDSSYANFIWKWKLI